MKYICDICGYVYDPAVGDPDNGVAPGTPAAVPVRRWRWEGRWRCPGGRLAPGDADAAGGSGMPGGGLTGRLPFYPAFTILPAPIPPTPFPSGEGGDHKLILPGASPPAPLRLCLRGTGGGWGGSVR